MYAIFISLCFIIIFVYYLYNEYTEKFKSRTKTKTQSYAVSSNTSKGSFIPSEDKCAKIIKSSSKGSSKGNIFDMEINTDDTIDGLKDVESLHELKQKYKKHKLKECRSSVNITNPERCSSAELYMKELNKFIDSTLLESEENTESAKQLLADRINKDEYKNIYPINNHDFDYQTAMLKKYNVYKRNITNKPTGATLANAPKRISKYMDVLIKNKFPEKKTVAGITDTITDNEQLRDIKITYEKLNKKLPYPTFREDFPECKYPTSGEHSSSYFIRSGNCKTQIKDYETCINKGYEWKGGDIVSNLKSIVSESDESQCIKPRFSYIDNSAKGIYGKNGLAMSLLNDVNSISPDKIEAIMNGYTVNGSGPLPCIDDPLPEEVIL